MHVIEICSVQEIPDLDAQTLDLLIVDVDQGVKSDWLLLSTLREQTHLATLPIIALSWESPVEDNVGAVPCACPPASLFSSLPFLPSRRGSALCLPAEDITFLTKPFDARALHGAIAKLLAERAAQKAAQLALVEAQVLAAYEQQHAAPSIWPVITAAGLLLVVTGLLFHFLIALVGMVLVLISLLVWTLGTKPVPSVSSSTVSTMSAVPVAN
jgi:hypothetical protein